MTSNALELMIGPNRMKAPVTDGRLVTEALQSLERGDIPWLTLSRSVVRFVTVRSHPDGGFEVQMEDGSSDLHCRLAGRPVPMDTVRKVITAFQRGQSNWREAYEWERVTLRKVDPECLPDSPPPSPPDLLDALARSGGG